MITAATEIGAAKTAATETVGDNPIVTKQGEDEAHTFTAADDAKLVEMKAAGKTWKEIVAEMKKSQSALKVRFKEIGPKADGGAGGAAPAGGEKKKEPEAKAAEEKNAEQKLPAPATTGKKTKKDANDASGAAAKVSLTFSG